MKMKKETSLPSYQMIPRPKNTNIFGNLTLLARRKYFCFTDTAKDSDESLFGHKTMSGTDASYYPGIIKDIRYVL